MRQVKFRAWDGEDMFSHENIGDDYDFQLAPNGLILMVNEQFHEMGSGVAEEYWRYVEIKDAVFMQSTGLTDKNGVDIYEGDIVEFLGEYKDEPNRQVLFDTDFLTYTILSKQEKEWVDNGSNHYKYCHQEGNADLYFLNDLDSYELEVIGNIHQHRELLNEKD